MALLQLFERYPFSRPLIALLLGIWIASEYPNHSAFAIYLAILFFIANTLSLLYPPKWSFRWINGANFLLFILIIGYLILPQTTPLPPDITNRNTDITASVIQQSTTKSGLIKLIAKIEESSQLDTILTNKNILITLKKNQNQTNLTNKIILFSSTLKPIYPTRNPFQFDYNNYLLSKNIYATAYLLQYKICETNPFPQSFTKKISYQVNSWLKQTYQKCGFEKDELGVMLALIDGDRSLISNEVKRDYQQTGTTHILAVSGLHVGVIMEMLLFLLAWLDKFKMRIIKVVIIVCLLWIYTIIAGLEASILRAAIMFSILLIARQLGRNAKLENSLFLSAFIILIFIPQSLFDAGFWLSYLAVGSIILYAKKIEGLIDFKNQTLKKCWQLTSVTLAAQIATAPYIIYLFGTFPTYFLFSNLLILPVVPLAMFGGIGVASISLITNHLGIANKLVIATISYMNLVVDFIQNLPMAQINLSGLTIGGLLLIYLIMALILLYTYDKSAKYLFAIQVTASFLLINFALTAYNTRKKDELAVFVSNGPVVTTKNGNSLNVYNIWNQYDKKTIEPYLKYHNQAKVKIDTSSKTQVITPFFKGDKFGIILKDTKYFANLNSLKYHPSYIVLNNLTTLDIQMQKSSSPHIIARICFNCQTKNIWNLDKEGAFIE